MKNLIATSALALVALQAGADPRLGTKACVVENARWFDPRSGEHGMWSDAQKSFVLNVYTCEEVSKREISIGTADNERCEEPLSNQLAITTSIEKFEHNWSEGLAHITKRRFADGVWTTEPDRIIAEFHSHIWYWPNSNSPLLRLHPDLQFTFLSHGGSGSEADKFRIYSLTGTCADFQ